MCAQPFSRKRFRFTLRGLLFGMLLAALGLGSLVSRWRAQDRLESVHRRLLVAQQQVRMAQSRAEVQLPAPTDNPPRRKGPFSGVRLDGASLRGVTITVDETIARKSAFGRTSFVGCDLEGASLTGDGAWFQGAQFDNANLTGARLAGGGASFQAARFDNANLTGSQLTGAGSSFQLASFNNADLTGATLTGGGGAFQGASFRGANFSGASVVCPNPGAFQSANIDGTHFPGADLSAVDSQALESCYFDTPPAYDASTKFPAGFEPNGWKRAPAPSE